MFFRGADCSMLTLFLTSIFLLFLFLISSILASRFIARDDGNIQVGMRLWRWCYVGGNMSNVTEYY